MRLTLPAAPDSVPVVRHAVTLLARDRGAPGPVAADVALAVSEACTSVVEHGARELVVEAELRDQTLEVVVAGRGGEAARADDGLGMGMALMAAVATGLQLDHDGAGIRLHLAFDLRTERPSGADRA